MPENLVERVARGICCGIDPCHAPTDGECNRHIFDDAARAAIRVVVEECAGVVEENANRCYGLPYHLLMANAAAIRALLEDGE